MPVFSSYTGFFVLGKLYPCGIIQLKIIFIVLDNKSVRNKGEIIGKLQQQLYDQNWKVRVVTYKSLSFENLLPNGHKLSFQDKLSKMIFGEPRIY